MTTADGHVFAFRDVKVGVGIVEGDSRGVCRGKNGEKEMIR